MNNSVDIPSLLDIARKKMTTDFPSAFTACSSAIQLAQKTEDVSAEAESRHLFAQVLFRNGKKTEALIQIKLAIEIRESLTDAAKVSVSLNSLGIILTEMGDFPEALQVFFRALQTREQLNDKKGIATTLINIGSIYHRLNNTEQELKMYERSLQIAEELGDRKLVANNHLNLGLLYTKKKEHEKALKYLEGLDEELISLGDTANATNALISQGQVFQQIGSYEKALEKHFVCLKLSRESGDIACITSSLMNIGYVKIQMGEAEEAKPFIEEGIALSVTNNQRINLKEGKLILSDYYTAKHDFESALKTFREYIVLKDELINAEKLQQLGELQLKYDLDKKASEAEINHLKNVALHEALSKLQDEKNRSDSLLLNILPEEVAEELKATGTAKAKLFESVTVMFIDIKNFTIISQQLSPEALVAEIDCLFRGFDKILKRYDVEKIKTIGDAYMCAGGIPLPDANSVEKVAYAAFDILDFIEELKQERINQGRTFFEVRIGINTGPVVAGIVGSSKFAYDIWGDTVNTAARMEQTGEVGKINVSGDTYLLLKEKYAFEYRGKINAKNKGEIDMYFLAQKN